MWVIILSLAEGYAYKEEAHGPRPTWKSVWVQISTKCQGLQQWEFSRSWGDIFCGPPRVGERCGQRRAAEPRVWTEEPGRRLLGSPRARRPGRLSGPGLAWDPRSAPGAPGQRCWEEAVKVARREGALALEFREVEGTVSCWKLEVSNRHPTLLWVVSRSC